MVISSYKQLGGVHPETAAITNILANQGFVSPHSGKPFSEAMILGIAGGLGAGYILWQFKQHDAVIVALGFQNRWNYTVDFMQQLCDRLGVQATFRETGGKKTAARHLEDSLKEGNATVAWVDRQSLPYLHLRPMYKGYFGHVVTVFGLDDGQVMIDDRAQKPLLVDAGQFAAARVTIGSNKNRLLLLHNGDAAPDVEAAVRSGIADCVDHLGGSSKTFALPVYEKWAEMLTDARNKKGWPRVFQNGKGLYSTLTSVHEAIKHFGTKGAGLRHLYADFLTEAQPLINGQAAEDASALYREAAARWTELADACLPQEIDVLDSARRLLARQYDLFLTGGREQNAELAEIAQQLQDMEVELNENLPLSPGEMRDLFAVLQDYVFAVYEAERAALAALSEVT